MTGCIEPYRVRVPAGSARAARAAQAGHIVDTIEDAAAARARIIDAVGHRLGLKTFAPLWQ